MVTIRFFGRFCGGGGRRPVWNDLISPLPHVPAICSRAALRLGHPQIFGSRHDQKYEDRLGERFPVVSLGLGAGDPRHDRFRLVDEPLSRAARSVLLPLDPCRHRLRDPAADGAAPGLARSSIRRRRCRPRPRAGRRSLPMSATARSISSSSWSRCWAGRIPARARLITRTSSACFNVPQFTAPDKRGGGRL